MSHEIKEFNTGDVPGNTFEAVEMTTTIPPWLDIEHPQFPRHFILSLLNKEGEVIVWWERLPKHLGGKN